MFSSRRKDTSELARVKAELATLKERSELLDSACGIGLWEAVLHNADALDPQSVWTWSPEFRRLVGYSSEADFPNVCRSWSDKLHPDDVDPTFAAFGAHLTDRTGRARYDVTYRLKTRSAAYRWFRATGGCRHAADGRTIRACGSLTDIHDQKLLELEFQEVAATDAVAIGALAAGLKAMAAGDLTHRITVAFSAKAQGLKDDFNEAVDRLREAMRAVTSSANGIRGGSDEISSAADDLSRRTEQQAASLEETAAALDEITATVKRSAEGAVQASASASSAKVDAEQSGAIVRDAVSAMGEIEHSSGRSPDHRGDRRDRLPDQPVGPERRGRGGAGRRRRSRFRRGGPGGAGPGPALRRRRQGDQDPDRQLQRPGRARGQAGGRHRSGPEHHRHQGRRHHRPISEIARSAQEQATGLNQVNVAVNQMDQVTQQNAAMVEQTTAAASNMKSEAGELARLVLRFKTGAEQAAPSRSDNARPPARQAPPPRQAPAAAPARRAAAGGSRGSAAVATQDWEEF